MSKSDLFILFTALILCIIVFGPWAHGEAGGAFMFHAIWISILVLPALSILLDKIERKEVK